MAELKCEGCGCTNARACPGGCCWVSTNPPWCSACLDHDVLPSAGPMAAEGADQDFCPESSIGMHTLLWLNPSSGFCIGCKAPFVAQAVA